MKIRTVAALRKAAANRRAVTGWSVARPDVEKPAAWVLRMPFDRVTEALARGMEVYTPKVRKVEKVKREKYRDLVEEEVFQKGDQFYHDGKWDDIEDWQWKNGARFKEKIYLPHRRPIGKATK